MKQKRKALNDRGAAIVTVLVVTVFITVIATTLLYVSAQNYQMKQTDYSNKQSFYAAEQTLDELKALLVADVQDAFVTAYEDTMQNYLKLNSQNQDKENYYQEAYANALIEIWNNRKNASDGSLLKAVQSLFTDEEKKKSIYQVADYGLYESADGSSAKFALKGVQVKYTKGTYTTFLYTDICLEAPQINFIMSSQTSVSETEAAEVEKIAFTDYVVYLNWRKADYDDTYNTSLGTKQTP